MLADYFESKTPHNTTRSDSRACGDSCSHGDRRSSGDSRPCRTPCASAKPRVRESIVVEGRDDSAAVLSAVRADIIITNGFKLRKPVIDRILTASVTNGVIVLTDPDRAGELIRRRIEDILRAKILPPSPQDSSRISGNVEGYTLKHARPLREDALREGDIGIENMSAETILDTLVKAGAVLEAPDLVGDVAEQCAERTDKKIDKQVGERTDKQIDGWRNEQVGERGERLTMEDLLRFGLVGADSKMLRSKLGKRLGIGYANAKQFLLRLERKRIGRNDLEELMRNREQFRERAQCPSGQNENGQTAHSEREENRIEQTRAERNVTAQSGQTHRGEDQQEEPSSLCLTSPTAIRKIMNRFGFEFSKSLGQNFLIDSNAVDKIVSAVRAAAQSSDRAAAQSSAESSESEQTAIIEIGPGFGVLTKRLCEISETVIAIEKDKTLPPILRELVPAPHLQIICEDVLKCDLDSVIRDAGCKDAVVVANLPYYITTPIIMKILEEAKRVRSLVVMMQKEVADRILDEGDRGAITMTAGYYAESTRIAAIKRTSFMPAPKVDSAVICMTRIPPRLMPAEENLYMRLVKAIYATRRKTLLNSLNSLNLCDKNALSNVIIELGYSPTVRGETLGIEDISILSKKFAALEEK